MKIHLEEMGERPDPRKSPPDGSPDADILPGFPDQAPTEPAPPPAEAAAVPEQAPIPAADDRDVVEIEVQLKDDTFDVEEKTVDEVDIKVRMPHRLKIGVAIVAFAFVMSGSVAIILPWSMATGNQALQWWCAIVYGASWIVMFIGIAIGGKAAKQIVTSWTVKAMGHTFGSLRRRGASDRTS